MKLKKFIAIMAVTAMVAGMATGCGGSKSDAGSDSTGSDTKTESLSGTITAAGSSALKPLADDAMRTRTYLLQLMQEDQEKD